jgi:hypothetical protein
MRRVKGEIAVETSIGNINKVLTQLKELITLVDDAVFIERLKTLYDKIEYSNPTRDIAIAKLDRKISDALGDLKIQLTTRQPRSVINHKTETITQLINERLAKA